MSIPEERELLLSQLVDGELPVDQANRVLAEVFDELAHVLDGAEAGKRLHDMLQLRRALGPWRQQEPRQTMVLAAVKSAGKSASGRRWLNYAAAAMLGGVLVAGGFFLGDRLGGERSDPQLAGQPRQPAPQAVQTARRAVQPATIVTPEQRREIARAFAFHESVAGPLSWYASDDSTIQVAPAVKGEALRQPIAVVLRLSRDLSTPGDKAAPPKTYVIVCRNSDAATIELPPWATVKTVQLRLFPTAADGEVNLRYAIVAADSAPDPDDAALTGSRQVGLGPTQLGQLAARRLPGQRRRQRLGDRKTQAVERGWK